MLAALKGILRRRGVIDRSPIKGFLRDASGVIHVGAHTGQERSRYAQYRLRVLWVEPLPELFAILQRNLAGFPDQRAVQCLVTDKDGQQYPFHITSNAGGSSSIFPLALHKDIWPDVREVATTTLTSKTLPTLLADANVAISGYDALVVDTQGSELLILEGAESILQSFRLIKVEVADFAAYDGCCQLAEIELYLERQRFVELARNTIARHPSGGAYYDVVYERK